MTRLTRCRLTEEVEAQQRENKVHKDNNDDQGEAHPDGLHEDAEEALQAGQHGQEPKQAQHADRPKGRDAVGPGDEDCHHADNRDEEVKDIKSIGKVAAPLRDELDDGLWQKAKADDVVD